MRRPLALYLQCLICKLPDFRCKFPTGKASYLKMLIQIVGNAVTETSTQKFFSPKEKNSYTYQIIINISNEEIPHTRLRKRIFHPKKTFLYLPKKKQFCKQKNFSYLPEITNFLNKKNSCICPPKKFLNEKNVFTYPKNDF